MQFLKQKAKKLLRAFLPFDRAVQPLYYYGQKLHSTQFVSMVSDSSIS